ncbi:DegV family protein [Hydrogeniiclostridium mannosilyticum]|uniref:DegV family protein n=1 Tax=Hydrogeniiclostridium mannosilyticum TaxID=2764322 RepID=UPI0018A94ECA|nr:DegV family protein [Hydrogeniiclostridium mannosilyticum]
MADFTIVTDSSCDLPDALAKEMGLTVLPLSVNIAGKEYRNLLDGSDISFAEFFRLLRASTPCTTSAVNVEAFRAAMEPILQAGRDILCIAFSSALSNTCNAAQMAAEDLAKSYPDRKIYVVDSLCASLGEGLLIYLAHKEREKGKSIDEVRLWLEQNKLQLCHWFTVDDLQHLRRGGRISSATAFFGAMLHIKPVLHVDNAGRLINVGKARGRRASLDALIGHMAKTAVAPETQTVFISHCDAQADAEYIARQIKQQLKVPKVIIHYVGPVISAHSGPGTVALFFLGTER